MRDFKGKRYWLVGASEGLGRALAHRLSDAGADLILSARNADRLSELAKTLPHPAQVVTVDVADPASVTQAAAEVGEVDGLVWLAGVYWPMRTTDWRPTEAEAMVDVNLTGAVRVLGHVVPSMVERNAGHIVLTGSLSAFRGLPGAIGYAASKAGLMSLGETMQLDLRGTGVEVQIANPGFIRTRLTDKNNFKMPALMEPKDAADEMMKLMLSHRSSRNFPFLFSLVFRLSRLLPDWAYIRLFGQKT